MSRSNTRPVHIQVQAPLDETGWEIRVYGPDMTSLLAVNPEFTALTFSLELNGEGGGSITFDKDTPMWKRPLDSGAPPRMLLDKQNLWEYWENGVRRAQWFSMVIDEHLVEDDQSRQVTVSGPGPGTVLNWGRVMPPGAPVVPIDGGSAAHQAWKWTFNYQAVMKSWLSLLHACQDRGTIAFVDPLFTNTHDAAGDIWLDDPNQPNGEYVEGISDKPYQPENGLSLMELLTTFTGQDAAQPATIFCEWNMRPGFRLDVRRQIGVHRERDVVFHDTVTTQVKERTRSRVEVANYAMLFDDSGRFLFRSDAESIAAYQQRETVYHMPNQTRTASQMRQMINNQVKLLKDEKSTWVITVRPDVAGRTVFEDYNLGDWIGVESDSYVIEPYRVMAIGGAVDSDGNYTVELTLESLFEYKQLELQRKLTYIENLVKGTPGQGGGTGATGSSGSDGSDGSDDGGDGGSDGSGGSDGGGYGVQSFVQHEDPGDAANQGDLWLKIPAST